MPRIWVQSPAKVTRTTLILAAALLVLLPWFFVGGPDWATGPLYRAVWNLGHVMYFGVLVLALQSMTGVGGWRQWLGISATALLFGALIELVQSTVGRQVDWRDILRNMIGAWLVLAWRQGAGDPDSRVLTRVGIWSARLGVTVLLTFQVVPVATIALQQYRLSQQVGVLYDADDPQAVHYWSGPIERAKVPGSDDHYGLTIKLDTSRYSGVSLDNLPGDWRGYRSVRFELYSHDPKPLSLTLRINDIAHDRGDNAYDDRFNTRLTVRPGWNEFRIDLTDIKNAPVARTMDMERIRRFGLFATALEQPQTVFLKDLRLE